MAWDKLPPNLRKRHYRAEMFDEEGIEHLNKHRKGLFPKIKEFQIKRTLRKLFSQYDGELGLEIGPGDGYFSSLIPEDKGDWVRVEISKNLARKLKRENPDEDIIVGDAHYLPIKKGAFNMVADLTTLATFRFGDLDCVIKEIHRVLKNGGAYLYVDDLGYLSTDYYVFGKDYCMDKFSEIFTHVKLELKNRSFDLLPRYILNSLYPYSSLSWGYVLCEK